MSRRQPISLFCVVMFVSLAVGAAHAQEAPPVAVSEPFTPSEEFQDWITALAREYLPHKYEKLDNWGHTKRRWDGLKIRFDDGHLHTKRRWKEVNDGTWKKYSVRLIEPDKRFDVRIENIHQTDGGKIAMDVSVVARLALFGRLSQWETGVQLISLSVDAQSTVRLRTQLEVALRLDPTKLPPDVRLIPEAKRARLDIVDFRLQRISNAHGPLVKSLSASVREVLEDKLEAENRGKLTEKINKQLAKSDDKLTFSLTDLLKSPWGDLAKESLETPGQE